MEVKKDSPLSDSKLNAVDALEQFWLKLMQDDVKNIVKFTEFKMPRSNRFTFKTEYFVNNILLALTGHSHFIQMKTLDELGKSSKAQLSNWIKGGGPEYESIVQHAEFIDKAACNLGDQTKLTLHELQDQLQNYAKHLGFYPVSQEEITESVEIHGTDPYELLISVYMHFLIAHLDATISIQLCKPSDLSKINLKPICLYTVFSKQIHPNSYRKQGGQFVLDSYRSESSGTFSYPTQNLFIYLTALSQLNDESTPKKLYGLPDFTAYNDPLGFKQTYIKNAKDRKSTIAFLDLLWLCSFDAKCSESSNKWSELSRADFYRQYFKEANDLGEGFGQVMNRIKNGDERFEDWTVIADHSWLYMIWLVYRFRLLGEQNFKQNEFVTTDFYHAIWQKHIDSQLIDTSHVNTEWPFEIQVLAQHDLPLSK